MLKEACCIPVGQPMNLRYFAFQPAFALDRLPTHDLNTVNYVFHYLDALHWNEGGHNVADFTSCFASGSILLCNGLEKSLFLQSLLPLCIVLNCNVSFTHLLPMCYLRCPTRLHKQCALTKAFQLYYHLINK
jgi:hypothetical protein